MKAKELFESPPYLHPGKYTPRGMSDSPNFMSDAAIVRDFTSLFDFTFGGLTLKFYLAKELYQVIAVHVDKKPTGVVSNKIVYTLDFKEAHTIINIPEEFKNKTILQVDSVYLDKKYRNRGLSSRVYIELSKLGFIVVSDTSQFEDGKMLWVKMAKETHFNAYKIYLLDSDYGFKLDKKKKPIVYDGSNIGDADIWTSDEDMSGANILLTMVN